MLKSTLLQLDSTFSEREYGVSTFRDFVQKLERAQFVTLRGDERSRLVELRDGTEIPDYVASTPAPAAVTPSPAPRAASAPAPAAAPTDTAAPIPVDSAAAPAADAAAAGQQAEGYAAIRDIFLRPGVVSRWPLYVRQAKQVIRAANESFDERRYGFNGIVDALRYAQREGLFRLDRDRQGVIRIYPGALLADVETSTPGSTDGTPAPEQADTFERSTSKSVAVEGDDLHEPGDVNGNIARPGEPRPTRPSRRNRGALGRRIPESPIESEPQTVIEPTPEGGLFPEPAQDASDVTREDTASSAPQEPEQAVIDVEAIEVESGEESGATASPAKPAPRRKTTRKKTAAAAAPRKKAAPAKKTARKSSR